jgi:predicted Zn-dependent protease
MPQDNISTELCEFGSFVVATRTTLLLSALLLASASGCAVNSVTGKQDLMFYSPEDDVKLGQKYAPQIEKALGGRFPDENLQSYVNRIGQRLARVCHRPDIAYHFAVVDYDGENAFAVPGGYVYITSGLLEKLGSEAQLAAILGHEIGHVVARDTMAALSRQKVMWAALGAALLSSSGDAVAGTMFTSSFLSLQYSRDDERDADLVGLAYMIQAGYDPNGMVETMRVLQSLQEVRPIEFFSTHPSPENRIIYIEERIERLYSSYDLLKEGREEYVENILSVLKERKEKKRKQMPQDLPEEGQTQEWSLGGHR